MKVCKVRVWQTNRNLKPVEWIIDVYDENGDEIVKIRSECEPKVVKEQ